MSSDGVLQLYGAANPRRRIENHRQLGTRTRRHLDLPGPRHNGFRLRQHGNMPYHPNGAAQRNQQPRNHRKRIGESRLPTSVSREVALPDSNHSGSMSRRTLQETHRRYTCCNTAKRYIHTVYRYIEEENWSGPGQEQDEISRSGRDLVLTAGEGLGKGEE